jgi:hypothetical protein
MLADFVGGAMAGTLGLPTGEALSAIADAARTASDIAAMGEGLLYLAPEYLYRKR